MSDRHAAEKRFNELLSEFRAEILPVVAKDWENLTRDEREQLMRVNNFLWTALSSWPCRLCRGDVESLGS